MTDKKFSFDMDEQEFLDYLDQFYAIEKTHSWRYGAYDVRCTMCHVSKGDLRSLEECPGPVSRGCF